MRPNLFALLIGIDCYLPNRLPDGSHYPSLNGCVRDITHVEDFLKRKLGLTDNQIFKLTATNRGTAEPPELHNQWPTYKNMVVVFRNLTDIAQAGDQVYIHYSGHGGRTPTLFPELKGENGLDESLIPTDIGSPAAQYLHDIELAHILKIMVDKGLIVTIVLDSCHSGGATRGMGGATVRGLSTIDTTQRPTESMVASHDVLTQTWHSLSQGTTRQVALGSGWLPDPQGYVLLAACRPSESAYEYPFDGKETNGALTYWLLDSLKQLGPGYTYKLLHDRIIAKIHTQFEQQTPQLQGEGRHAVFGSGYVQPHYAVNVMSVDLTNSRILLNAGQPQTIRKGAQFAVYPPGETNFTQTSKRLALVEITEVGATDSWARIVTSFTSSPIEQGAQAVLLDPGSVRLRRTVRLVHQANLPPTIPQDAALKAVERTLAQSRFVEIAAKDMAPDYQVVVNAKGEYEIWDPGGIPVANLRPALQINNPASPAQLVQRLEHLTKYRNIQQLDNNDPLSPLARKLVIELAGIQSEYDPMDRPEPQSFAEPGSTPILKPGEWTFLYIKNASLQVLNVTVLDLGPDWSIIQMYPSAQGGFYESLDPGQELLLPLQAHLPDGYTDATDVLKVFATLGSANFRWLELPALDHPPQSRATRGPANPLEELLAALAVEEPKTRQLNRAMYPTREWTTAQVEVRVRQPALGNP